MNEFINKAVLKLFKKEYPCIGLLLIVVFFSSCAEKKEVVQEVRVVEHGNAPAQGPGDWGGAGCIDHPEKCILFDEYLLTVPELDFFNQKVKPILKNLDSSFPQLAKDFMHIFANRSWYFIPTDLNQIPGYVIGDAFKFKQVAIQNGSAVWVNSAIYDKAIEDSKLYLYFHEALVGIAILENTNSQDQCIAEISKYLLPSEFDQKRFRDEKNSCLRKYPLGTEVKFKISDGEYNVLRRLVQLVISSEGNVNEEDVRSYLIGNGYKRYFTETQKAQAKSVLEPINIQAPNDL